jgi:hypothetical protein
LVLFFQKKNRLLTLPNAASTNQAIQLVAAVQRVLPVSAGFTSIALNGAISAGPMKGNG